MSPISDHSGYKIDCLAPFCLILKFIFWTFCELEWGKISISKVGYLPVNRKFLSNWFGYVHKEGTKQKVLLKRTIHYKWTRTKLTSWSSSSVELQHEKHRFGGFLENVNVECTNCSVASSVVQLVSAVWSTSTPSWMNTRNIKEEWVADERNLYKKQKVGFQ